MVSFAPQPHPQPNEPQLQLQPQLEHPQPQPKNPNPKDPFDIFDAQATDFTLADSFLDFDSMQAWFEDNKPIPSLDMATQEDDNNNNNNNNDNDNNNNGLALATPSSLQAEQDIANGSDPCAVGSIHAVKVETPEPQRENLGTSGCAIEEGMEKISLVSGCGSSVRMEGNGVINAEIITNDEDEDEGQSEGSDSEIAGTSSSSTSCESSSSSTSSDSEGGNDNNEEKEEEDEQNVVDEEVEDGEIRGFDAQELVTETAADDHDSEDAETTATWINDDDDVGDDEGEDGNNTARGPIRSKNELEILPSVPPVKVSLEPHHQMLPVGVVMSIVGARVIVEGVEKHDPLNEGSILWMTETRTPLGLVDEIFGPVKNPYYVVRYNSENEVPSGIHGGTRISFVPEFANHVLNNKDLYRKGYDASGVNDEEVSDESEFSDDEKEAEYKRMQRMAKRGTNDQNPGKRKNNRKKVSPKEGMVPTYPVATPTPLLDRGHCPPFSGIGQGLLGATTAVSPFPPTNSGPNLTPSGVWTNGTIPLQPQSALLPNGFPTNGISLYPGIPFQQQLYPNHGFPSTSMFPGVQPNIFAQPMYAQGLVGQNQMPVGWSSPFPQIQPPISAGQQGFLSSGLQSEINSNLHSGSIPSNHHPRPQFQPGASSASRGRKTFHRGGRKGWRPAK